jgi:hypothetical protein
MPSTENINKSFGPKNIKRMKLDLETVSHELGFQPGLPDGIFSNQNSQFG